MLSTYLHTYRLVTHRDLFAFDVRHVLMNTQKDDGSHECCIQKQHEVRCVESGKKYLWILDQVAKRRPSKTVGERKLKHPTQQSTVRSMW